MMQQYTMNETNKHDFGCELFTIVQVHTRYLLEQTHLRLPRKNPQSRLPRKNPPLCQQKSKTFFTANLMCTKWLTYSNLPPFSKQSQFMHPFYVVTTYQIVLNQYTEKKNEHEQLLKAVILKTESTFPLLCPCFQFRMAI